MAIIFFMQHVVWFSCREGSRVIIGEHLKTLMEKAEEEDKEREARAMEEKENMYLEKERLKEEKRRKFFKEAEEVRQAQASFEGFHVEQG